MYIHSDEILKAEHEILMQLVNKMTEEPVDAESVCSFFSGVVSMADSLLMKEGDG